MNRYSKTELWKMVRFYMNGPVANKTRRNAIRLAIKVLRAQIGSDT